MLSISYEEARSLFDQQKKNRIQLFCDQYNFYRAEAIKYRDIINVFSSYRNEITDGKFDKMVEFLANYMDLRYLVKPKIETVEGYVLSFFPLHRKLTCMIVLPSTHVENEEIALFVKLKKARKIADMLILIKANKKDIYSTTILKLHGSGLRLYCAENFLADLLTAINVYRASILEIRRVLSQLKEKIDLCQKEKYSIEMYEKATGSSKLLPDIFDEIDLESLSKLPRSC